MKVQNIRRFVRSVVAEAMKSSRSSMPNSARGIYQRSLRDLSAEWKRVERMTFDVGSWGDDWLDASDDVIADEVMIERKDEMMRIICDYYGINSYDSLASELNKLVRQHFWDLRDEPGFM